MQRNTEKCPHCGQTFVRITAQNPLVNRSDGIRFHVTLFAGPYQRPTFSGALYHDQVICNFAYGQFRLKNYTVLVVITRAQKDPEEVLRQAEDVADKLAEMLEKGHRPTAMYTFNGRELTPGFPV